SCTTIATLIEEPISPNSNNITDLSEYEAKLSGYVMYLQSFLVKTKKKVNDLNYPDFTFFDPSLLKSEHSIKALLHNIKLFQDYIKNTKPIAKAVYKKYSKLKT
uniref:BBA14 family lipoprotein n=1 Tax=Borrelia persica TaxID=44448 RepID=UPI00046733CB